MPVIGDYFVFFKVKNFILNFEDTEAIEVSSLDFNKIALFIFFNSLLFISLDPSDIFFLLILFFEEYRNILADLSKRLVFAFFFFIFIKASEFKLS